MLFTLVVAMMATAFASAQTCASKCKESKQQCEVSAKDRCKEAKAACEKK